MDIANKITAEADFVCSMAERLRENVKQHVIVKKEVGRAIRGYGVNQSGTRASIHREITELRAALLDLSALIG